MLRSAGHVGWHRARRRRATARGAPALVVCAASCIASTLLTAALSAPPCRPPPRSGPARRGVAGQQQQQQQAQGRPLRIVTYNIRGFGSGFSPAGKEPREVSLAYERVLADIARLEPDVLCLNEVSRFPLPYPEGGRAPRGDSLEALAEDLGNMHINFVHATPGVEHFGNAALVSSALQVCGTSSARLSGGSTVRTAEGRSKTIVRSVAAVHVSGPPLSEAGIGLEAVAVLATHWDHIAGEQRLLQAQSLCSMQEELSGGLPHVVLGDFNAFKSSDYTREEWEALESRHREKGWPPPRGCRSLEALEQAGYEDLLQRSLEGAGGDGLSAVPARRKMTAPADSPGMRIDYAYADAGLAASLDAGLPLAAYVDEQATSSDHFPLCIELGGR